MRFMREIFRLPSAAILLGIVLTSAIAADCVQAQSLAVGGRVSTLGLGVEGSFTMLDRIGARVGVNALSFSVDGEADDIDFVFDVDLLTATFLADVYLTRGGLRVSAGLVSNENKLGLVAELQEDVEIGDSTYSDVDVGDLIGKIGFDDVKPYLGVGIDSSLNKGGGLGFIVEFGVLFQGSPKVLLEADGPVSNDPQFLSDLAKEQEDISDDLSFFKVYPVIAVGISYHL